MERPSMILDVDGKQQLYEWKLSEYSSHVEPAFEFTRRYIDELQAENAKLRQQLADVTVSMGRVEERCAKLREAVKRMHEHIKEACGECDGWYCSNFDEDNECCVYDTLARELGVEL